MNHTACYRSPLGPLLLTADEIGITSLYLKGQCSSALAGQTGSSPILSQANQWLDLYFSGREPDFLPALHLMGTPFQQEVWQILLTIPYGHTATYGSIARQLAAQQGIPRMSAQAVGGAVGRNPVSIIVPCHRVIGANGSLTGYAGGIDNKIALLTLEGSLASNFTLPKTNR